MKVHPTILLVTCTILGLFLLGEYTVALLRSTQDCAHNIGCYLSDRSINKSTELQQRMQLARHNHSIAQTKFKAFVQHSVVNNENKLHYNSTKLADTFEAYLLRLTQRQNNITENTDIQNARTNAQKDYNNCKQSIEKQFSQALCLENWDEYEQKCIAKIGDTKSILNELAKEANGIQDKINEWIKLPESSHTDVQWARQIFKQRMENNTKFRDELTRYIEKKRAEIAKQEVDSNKAMEKIRLVNQSYLECALNRKEFKACQQITKEVRGLNAQTLQDLKEMIEAKRQLLTNLMEFLKGQQGSKDMQHLNQVYKRQLEEFKSMMREFITYSVQTQKACGCTEQEEQRYKQQLQSLTSTRDNNLVSIALLYTQLSSAEADLKKVEIDRDAIFDDFKSAVQKSEGTIDKKDSQLNRLNQQLLGKNQEISKLKAHYYSVFQKCDEVKARLAKRVHNIDAIQNCLAKKHYYHQLLSQSKKYINSANESFQVQEIKRKLRDQLAAIEI